MLSFEDYTIQLELLYKSHVFQEKNGYVTHNISKTIFIVYLKANKRIAEITGATIVILRIEYSQIYREPTLYIQLQQEYTDVSGFLVTKLCVIPDMTIILPNHIQGSFVIEPEQCHGAIWWCFHQCNTTDIVGDGELYKDTYLKRWISSYIDAWV
ncbi:similar to Saccharomyces cerevisiae YLL042C ATG10 Conserved E2-like conjugating enzyme that mediates formation of the Atg12p-Atg5p conjugate, which is a critical step in autophagy [Maudiozyma saulgeensis]|uniref:Similar to Saccharomyces cerevisiae YLL042C ATG10 Conserved E2-like conjugating enzyme that mediates formation of the Atg12p-Atg5p conjugate, which is a critical step in autophagy n=1 Tax=Maudiozyma saulgeensis TaxID=1789683 RepID=A0A1X7RBA5_9SACH|nr:similar to Saccharomyces cerevisiae YLL042C ATG10 Conserved E2-like conjugating enzyme that mediates formation of the Atg12p-Atg5p conjugate, which is a critical step in autophagy [Kazachstania saulgeensis]